jgi:hypothetical protein
MKFTIKQFSFSLTSAVVIFLIVAFLHPDLLPSLIEAIKHWKS